MRLIRHLYHFLGGISFALILIASVAFFVIAGTFIESATQSHRYAAYFTYSNPLFSLLLWGFFVNILFSALRRWPFKIRHIPFLITHFGLLMILGGVLIKHYWGVQGSMSLVEGSGSHKIFETGSLALHIDSRDPKILPRHFPINQMSSTKYQSLLADQNDGLSLRLMNVSPHSEETLTSWVKGDWAVIQGLQPLKLYEDDPSFQKEIPIGGKVKFHPRSGMVWNLFAVRTDTPLKVMEQIYCQGAKVRVVDRLTKNILLETSLKEALIHPWPLQENSGNYEKIWVRLHLDFSPIDGFGEPLLEINAVSSEGSIKEISVPLSGSKSLLNLNPSSGYLGHFPISIDIEREPALAIIQDYNQEVYLAAFDVSGQVWCQACSKEHLDALFAYDDGFGGYAAHIELPFQSRDISRQVREEALLFQLRQQLQKAVDEKTPLAPPLSLLKDACSKAQADFVKSCLEFLSAWDSTHSWLYPQHVKLPPTLTPIFAFIDWNTLSRHERQGCNLSATFFPQFEADLQNSRDLIELLKERKWPLIKAIEGSRRRSGPCNPEETAELLTLLTQQIFAAAERIPSCENAFHPVSAEEAAAHLSAYFRAYGIHLATVMPKAEEKSEMEAILADYMKNTLKIENGDSLITLETPIVPLIKAAAPGKKVEDNLPCIIFEAKKEGFSQTVALTYDRYGAGLKWPILNGAYRARFQPLFLSIPYHLRLRQARQINYANSSQPYSFESDLIITDRRTHRSIEKTISMNNVYESWDGYRFYLASIGPAGDGTLKHVQIVVNHDPAKYWLTYPGAFIFSFGIILLFIMRPYRKTKDKSSQ